MLFVSTMTVAEGLTLTTQPEHLVTHIADAMRSPYSCLAYKLSSCGRKHYASPTCLKDIPKYKLMTTTRIKSYKVFSSR